MTNLNIPVGVSDFSKEKHSKRHADYSPQTIWKDAGYEYAGTFFRYST